MSGVNRRQWQAPPGWPTPPPGWAPPSGWQPESSWPAPPAGWQWWLPVQRTRWQRVRLGLVVGLPSAAVLVLLGTLIGAQVADDRAGCGSVDPTDPANYSTVAIFNDMSAPVVIDGCLGGYCRPEQDSILLKPGQRTTVDAACAASGGDMTSWRLKGGGGGALLGYIAVDTPRKRDGLVFLVSHASPNRRTATPAG
jgi:hypothetical protein